MEDTLSSKLEFMAILSSVARSAAALASLAVDAAYGSATVHYGSDVEGQRFASLPRNQCEVVQPFAI